MKPITLTTARLLLRPFESRDVDAVVAACQDPEIRRFTTVPDPYERKHAEEFVCVNCPAGWQTDTAYNFGVFAKEDGALVGSMGLVRADRLQTVDRRAEIGYWTAKERRGQGYTVESGRALIDWAFTRLGAERLDWLAEVGNEGSRAVARRLGFVAEGVQRARIVQRGTRRDAWVAGLLPSDWGRSSETPYLPTAD
jgi:RimJ/RimL family protein N-acetyltransferase